MTQNIEKITKKLGITLNNMQQAAQQTLLEEKENVIILSPTGSGKTLSYLLPLTQLLDKTSDVTKRQMKCRRLLLYQAVNLPCSRPMCLKIWAVACVEWHAMVGA